MLLASASQIDHGSSAALVGSYSSFLPSSSLSPTAPPQVCRDLRRLLVTDAEPGSFGPLTIVFTEYVNRWFHWTWRGGDVTLALNPDYLSQHLWPLIRLLGHNRSHRFSKIKICVRYTIGDPPEPSDARINLTALSSILVWLQADGYSGELALDDIRLARSELVHEFSNIVQQLWTPTRVGLIDLRHPKLRRDGPQALAALGGLSEAKNIVGISLLALPAIPTVSFSSILSSLAPIGGLEIGPEWGKWMTSPPPLDPFEAQGEHRSLTQISGLTNLSRLTWFPDLDLPGPPLQVLPTLSNLVNLQLRQVPIDSWNLALSTVLTALGKLTSVSLNVWEDVNMMDIDGIAEVTGSHLSTLAPLSLPPSISALELGFSPFRLRKSLQVDLFENMEVCHGLESMCLSTFGDTEPGAEGAPGAKTFSLTLGASLRRIPGLKSLTVMTAGSWKEQAAIHFPRELSCLTSLTQLVTRGSCGIHRIETMPHTWVAAGFRDRGELCSLCKSSILASVLDRPFANVMTVSWPAATSRALFRTRAENRACLCP